MPIVDLCCDVGLEPIIILRTFSFKVEHVAKICKIGNHMAALCTKSADPGSPMTLFDSIPCLNSNQITQQLMDY